MTFFMWVVPWKAIEWINQNVGKEKNHTHTKKRMRLHAVIFKNYIFIITKM